MNNDKNEVWYNPERNLIGVYFPVNGVLTIKLGWYVIAPKNGLKTMGWEYIGVW